MKRINNKLKHDLNEGINNQTQRTRVNNLKLAMSPILDLASKAGLCQSSNTLRANPNYKAFKPLSI